MVTGASLGATFLHPPPVTILDDRTRPGFAAPFVSLTAASRDVLGPELFGDGVMEHVRVLLVFPSTSRSLMGGSTGELTGLMRLARSLDETQFKCSYAEAIRTSEQDPNVDSLARSVKAGALTIGGWSEPSAVPSRPCQLVRPEADLIVLSGARTFLRYPIFSRWTKELIAQCASSHTPLAILDLCGDTFLTPPPSGVWALIPTPFSYTNATAPTQVAFQCGVVHHPSLVSRRWLWLNASWMSRYATFRVAENVFDIVAARTEATILRAGVSPSSYHASGAQGSYSFFDSLLDDCSLVITANHRSALAARATARGRPAIWVDAANICTDPAYGSALNTALEAAHAERLPPSPIPTEFQVSVRGGASEIYSMLKAVAKSEEVLIERQFRRLAEYLKLPTADEALRQVLTHV